MVTCCYGHLCTGEAKNGTHLPSVIYLNRPLVHSCAEMTMLNESAELEGGGFGLEEEGPC